MDALDLLAQDNYIIVNKTLIQEIGLENSVIIGAMCGYQRGFKNDFFYREQEKIMEDTGLTEYTIRKCIKELSDLGFIEVKKMGMPAKMYYHINLQKFIFLSSRSIENDTSRGCENDTTIINNNNITNNYNKNNNNKNESINKEIQKKKTNADIIYDYYLDKSIEFGHAQRRVSATDTTMNNIKRYLREYSLDIMKETIDRYFEVINDTNYFFNTYWNAEKFFRQSNTFKDFLEDGNKWINYLKFKNNPKQKQDRYNSNKLENQSNEWAHDFFNSLPGTFNPK